MAHVSACAVCHSDDGTALPTKFVHSSPSLTGQLGIRIGIDRLEIREASGCQPCILLSNFLRVFQNLSPDFETSYFQGELSHLFLQRSDIGTLFVGLGREGEDDTYLDHFEIYTEKSKS